MAVPLYGEPADCGEAVSQGTHGVSVVVFVHGDPTDKGSSVSIAVAGTATLDLHARGAQRVALAVTVDRNPAEAGGAASV